MLFTFVSFVASNPRESLPILVAFYALLSFFVWIAHRKDRESQVSSIGDVLTFTLIGSACFHVLTVLFGAPFFEYVKLTFLYSMLLSVLTVTPASVLLGHNSQGWIRIFLKTNPRTRSECILLGQCCCTLLGTWLGAAAIPLDWERPWQVWPIPCVLGACAGHLIGLGAGLAVWILYGKRKHLID
ncbi:phosphatidylinositol-glycan biosynthesis class F protein-like [Oscarella lobularis]|uniref:phosphatidylinositol-glycan biosynthesis class F protein-like n=1 Tax=Oscarella lobularis TaxID=121494 RepID=UPI0033133534